jgi:hypothetical protein
MSGARAPSRGLAVVPCIIIIIIHHDMAEIAHCSPVSSIATTEVHGYLSHHITFVDNRCSAVQLVGPKVPWEGLEVRKCDLSAERLIWTHVSGL